MALHPKALRAIKRSALYATIISLPGTVCWFLNGWIAETIGFVLTAPGEFVNAVLYDLFPNFVRVTGIYIAIAASWVFYFGLFFVFHFAAYYEGHE